MNDYIIECDTTGSEVYTITAATEEEAKEILYSGTVDPVVSEVLSFEVKNIRIQEAK